jgi:hypothetical protein
MAMGVPIFEKLLMFTITLSESMDTILVSENNWYGVSRYKWETLA